MESFDDVKTNLLEERLPSAFDKALLVSKKAETMIYMSIVKCLESFSDVCIDFEENDPVVAFFDKWDSEGHIDGALTYGDIGEGKRRLACSFDLYRIRDTFETINSELFGTISDEYAKKLDDSSKLVISGEEVAQLEKQFKKVNNN
ncbi:MAG: hypothetical protein J6C28_04320 [Bacilli bacterium]|nr:hypothetical protein [Bacilli bacterium]